MRVPRELLQDTITVEDFSGSGSHGPTYADARSVRAAVQPTKRVEADAHGVLLAVDTLVVIRPEDGPLRPESRVTAGGTVYRVVQSYAMPNERRPSFFEVALARYAPGSGGGEGGGSGSGS